VAYVALPACIKLREAKDFGRLIGELGNDEGESGEA